MYLWDIISERDKSYYFGSGRSTGEQLIVMRMGTPHWGYERRAWSTMTAQRYITYPLEIISRLGLFRWVCSTMAAFHCLPTRHPHMLRLLPAASAFASSVITITPVCQVRDSQVSKSFPLSLVLEAVQRVQGGRMPRERGRERSGETVQALTCTACIYLHCDCVYLHFVLHKTFSQYAFVRFFL